MNNDVKIHNRLTNRLQKLILRKRDQAIIIIYFQNFCNQLK